MNIRFCMMGLTIFLLAARVTHAAAPALESAPAHEPAPAHAPAPHASPAHTADAHAIAYDHPTIAAPAQWAGATVIVILGMFVLAAAVGVGVRMNAPDELPATHSHDEPPGASHHHGPGGTVQPGPEHELPGGHAHH